MTKKDQTPVATNNDVNQFLTKVANAPLPVKSGEKGKLVFAMDATASREPTWDHACHLQGEMFGATDNLGGLRIQLCYYRGFNQFYASPWCDHSAELLAEMTAARCLGGHTQIHKVLTHLLEENSRQKIQTAVFVGDAIEEDADKLCHLAGKLGVLSIPLFVFQEGYNPRVTTVFKQMAQLSGGAFAPFDIHSASQLKNLLSAVAIYAAGGKDALTRLAKQSSREVNKLIEQLKE